MAYPLNPDEVSAGDAIAVTLEKMWGWYLAGGIVTLLFGFFMVSFKDATFYALTYFAGAYFIAAGLIQLMAGVSLPRHKWLFIITGALSVASGILLFVWPHITIYIVAIVLGWSFLVYGITDLVHALQHRHLPHWWISLIRGILSLVIAFLVLHHPGSAVGALIILLGIGAMLFGTVEIASAFTARHATRHWEALKSQLG